MLITRRMAVAILASLFSARLSASTIDPSPCPVEIPATANADCFVLRVPENRLKPNSRTIELPVVILRSTKPDKKPEPVLFTTGGPGGTTLRNMKGRANVPQILNRDVILLEQRGNRYTKPALLCPEMNQVRAAESELNISGAEAVKREVDAATICRKRFIADGIDLDGYNTRESAADIADLRALLKIDQLNLYGVSYAAHLMLVVMREHPEGIRAVFLDSVLPTNVNYDEHGRSNLIRAIDAIFSDCEADPACSRAHPSVRKNFDAVVSRLNAHPLAATMKSADGKNDLAYRINGRNVFEAIEVLLNDAQTIASIPNLIDTAFAADYSSLKSALQQNIGEGGYNWGARISVWCHDMAPFNDPAAVAREAARHPEMGGFPSTAVAPEVCALWNATPATADYAQPVTSSIPALVYAGEYDPNTPPQWGMLTTQALPKATFVSFAGMTHGAGETRCGWTLFARFLDDPAKPLDLTCASRFTYPHFAP
jgi:pimeloyl-ACP methyl ester carboxylesterase